MFQTRLKQVAVLKRWRVPDSCICFWGSTPTIFEEFVIYLVYE